jgi:hypothetical protein
MKIRPLRDRILVARVAEQEVGRGWGPCPRRPGESPGLAASHRVQRHRRDVVREPVALGGRFQRANYREAGGEG